MCAVADIALEQTVYSFTEQSGPLQVCIKITNNVTVEANFSITVQTDADGGTAEIGDFEIFMNEIIISSGLSCFEIKVFLDAILEGEETFRVSIESTDSALNVVVPQAEVRILDSTSKFLLLCWNKLCLNCCHAVADVALEQTAYEFSEQSEPFQVCINITNNVTVEANFSISVQTDAEEGTAEIGDFGKFEKEIVVSTRQTCFEIKIILDAILETNETFKVYIESTDFSALNVVVPQAEITILDSTSEFIVHCHDYIY